VVSEKIFSEIDQPETRIVYGSHVCTWIGSFGQAVSEEEIKM
jgi:hypothetical protein